MRFYYKFSLALLIGFLGLFLFGDRIFTRSILFTSRTPDVAKEPTSLTETLNQAVPAMYAPHGNGSQLEQVQLFDTFSTGNIPEFRANTSTKSLVSSIYSETYKSKAFEVLLSNNDTTVEAYREFFADWAARDADSASMHLNKLRGENRYAALEGLALQNPTAALAWVRLLVAGSDKASAQEIVFRQYALQNTEEAKAAYWMLDDLKEKQLMAVEISKQIATKDPANALLWLQSLPESKCECACMHTNNF